MTEDGPMLRWLRSLRAHWVGPIEPTPPAVNTAGFDVLVDEGVIGYRCRACADPKDTRSLLLRAHWGPTPHKVSLDAYGDRLPRLVDQGVIIFTVATPAGQINTALEVHRLRCKVKSEAVEVVGDEVTIGR